MKEITYLMNEWELIKKDRVGGRVVFHFDSRLYRGVVQVQISVSNTFSDAENQAWRMLGATVA